MQVARGKQVVSLFYFILLLLLFFELFPYFMWIKGMFGWGWNMVDEK